MIKNNMNKIAAILFASLLIISFSTAFYPAFLDINSSEETEGIEEAPENTSDIEEDSSDTVNTNGQPDFERYILEVDQAAYQPERIEDLGGEIRYEYSIIDGVAVEVPEHAADQLENIGFVERVERDRDTELVLPDTPEQDPREDDDDGDDSGDENTGSDVTIAVLDTGIDNNHQDFEGRIVDNQDFTGDGYEDNHGHGTHVASIAAGDGDHPGVATEALLKNVKVLDDDGQGSMSDAIAGIDYSVENNAEVIVLSLGAQTDNCDGTDMLSESVDNAVEQGTSVSISAGNLGPEEQTVTIPACSQDGFAVASTDADDEDIAGYSSRGLTSDNRIKPDISAPGTGIIAAEAGTEDGYTVKSGTSMAAPYIAGNLALLKEEEPGLTPFDYYEAIEETAIDLEEDEKAQGSGRTDIEASIEYITGEETAEAEQEDEETEEETREQNGQEQQEEESEENAEDVRQERNESDQDTEPRNDSQPEERNDTEIEQPEQAENDEGVERGRFNGFLQDWIASLNFF